MAVKQLKHIRTVATYSRSTGMLLSEEHSVVERGPNIQDTVEVFGKGFMESVKQSEQAEGSPVKLTDKVPAKAIALCKASGE